ncbi:hypothetical protein PSECIP111951_04181 [Pseudoalteromonas holothuriae]|uniref:Uncharacterized protein n=2 Tax=Pseudoalteromonas holothuriae TaxID=2963714 RepID=A0ABN8US41_9GAMM|nr:hypothetical protein PSECIP111951_04181 [Pseudoalteromonas sp. CIP111951]
MNPITGIVNSGVRYGADKLFGNQASWNFGNVAVDAFGNAIGNSIVNHHVESAARQKYISETGQKLSANTQAKVNQQGAKSLNNTLADAQTSINATTQSTLGMLQASQRADADAQFAAEEARRASRQQGVVDNANGLSASYTQQLHDKTLSVQRSQSLIANNQVWVDRNTTTMARVPQGFDLESSLIGSIDWTDMSQPLTPGPWREEYVFPSSTTNQGDLLGGLLGVVGSTGTGLSGAYVAAQLPLGGIEISSQKHMFTAVHSTAIYSTGISNFTATQGYIGAKPLFTELNSPNYRVLKATDNAVNGSLGIAFNGNNIAGKFNGISIADTLDSVGQKVFYAQTALQLTNLGNSFIDDFSNSEYSTYTISQKTKDLTKQTGLDVTFGAIGTFGGPVGATVGLGYTFRHELMDASKVSFENKIKEAQFIMDNR